MNISTPIIRISKNPTFAPSYFKKASLMKARFLFIISLAFLVSCTKQGPIGLTGPQGPQGNQGTTGNTGPTGPTGVTNISSMIDSVPPAGWNAAVGYYYYTIPETYITATDSDIVSVAITTSLSSSATWYPAPYTSFLTTGDQVTYNYTLNSFTINYVFATSPLQQIYFKVTVMKSTASNKRSGKPYGLISE